MEKFAEQVTQQLANDINTAVNYKLAMLTINSQTTKTAGVLGGLGGALAGGLYGAGIGGLGGASLGHLKTQLWDDVDTADEAWRSLKNNSRTGALALGLLGGGLGTLAGGIGGFLSPTI